MGKIAGLHNFELHAYRAAFQMVRFNMFFCYSLTRILPDIRYFPAIYTESLLLSVIWFY